MEARARKIEIPHAVNLALALFFAALHLYGLLILPAWILPDFPSLLPSAAPMALLSPVLWALIHESIHGHLFSSPQANRLAGRLLSIFFGSPFRVLSAGHLLHHRYNRDPSEQVEVILSRSRISVLDRVRYYSRLCFGLYAREFFSPILLALLGVSAAKATLGKRDGYETLVARKLLSDARHLREIRTDAYAVLALYSASAILYGSVSGTALAFWVGLWATRAFLISVLDNSYHYDSPMEDRLSGFNFRTPALVSKLMLHSNLHGTHHRYPWATWNQLPALRERDPRGAFAGGFIKYCLKQFRGPILPWKMTYPPVAEPAMKGARNAG